MGDQDSSPKDGEAQGSSPAVKIKLLNQSDTSETVIPVQGLDETVASVRRKVADLCSVSNLERIRLIYKGHVLKDGSTLAENQFDLDHALHAVVRPASVPPTQGQQGGTRAAPQGSGGPVPTYEDGFVDMDFMANLLNRASLAPMRQPPPPRACTHDLALVSPENGPASSRSGRDSVRSMFSCSECGVVMPGNAMHCEVCQIFLCPTCYRDFQNQRRGQRREDASARPEPSRPMQNSGGPPPGNPFAELFARAVSGQPVAMGSFGGPVPGPGGQSGGASGSGNGNRGRGNQGGADRGNAGGGGQDRGGQGGGGGMAGAFGGEGFGVRMVPAEEMQGLFERLAAGDGGFPVQSWPPPRDGSLFGQNIQGGLFQTQEASRNGTNQGQNQNQNRNPNQTQPRQPTETETNTATRGTTNAAGDDDDDSLPDLVQDSSDSEYEDAINYRHQAQAPTQGTAASSTPTAPTTTTTTNQTQRQPQTQEPTRARDGDELSSDGVPDLISSDGSESDIMEDGERNESGQRFVENLSLQQLSTDLAHLRQLEGFSPRISGLSASETGFSPQVMEFYQLFMDVSPLLLKTAVTFGRVQGNLSGEGFAPEVENYNAGMARVLRSLADISDELADMLDNATPHARGSNRDRGRTDAQASNRMPHEVPPPSIPEALGGSMSGSFPASFSGSIPMPIPMRMPSRGPRQQQSTRQPSAGQTGTRPAQTAQRPEANANGTAASRAPVAAAAPAASGTGATAGSASGSATRTADVKDKGKKADAKESTTAKEPATKEPVAKKELSTKETSAKETSTKEPATKGPTTQDLVMKATKQKDASVKGKSSAGASAGASAGGGSASGSSSSSTKSSGAAKTKASSPKASTGSSSSGSHAHQQAGASGSPRASTAGAFRQAVPAFFGQGLVSSELSVPTILEQVQQAETTLFEPLRPNGESGAGRHGAGTDLD